MSLPKNNVMNFLGNASNLPKVISQVHPQLQKISRIFSNVQQVRTPILWSYRPSEGHFRLKYCHKNHRFVYFIGDVICLLPIGIQYFLSKTIFIINCQMSQQENNTLLSCKSHQNDRISGKTCSTVSEIEENSPLAPYFIPQSPHEFRFQLFEASLQGVEISQKVNQRAVSWIITICWSKSLSQQCLWSTLLLYYTCKAKRKIRKQDLELTLLTCLCLSLKMTSSQCYHPRELAALSSKQLRASDIIEMQQTILELVGYNLVISHQLCELMNDNRFSQDRKYEILMICELLMVRDYKIFLNHSKLECIVKMLGGEEMQHQEEEDLLQQIRDLLQMKQCKIIINKYSSKFDTELLKARFL